MCPNHLQNSIIISKCSCYSIEKLFWCMLLVNVFFKLGENSVALKSRCKNWEYLSECCSHLWSEQCKGQKKLKLFFQANVSSEKRTKEFNFTTMRLVFVRFLEETLAWKFHFHFVWPLKVFSFVGKI